MSRSMSEYVYISLFFFGDMLTIRLMDLGPPVRRAIDGIRGWVQNVQCGQDLSVYARGRSVER